MGSLAERKPPLFLMKILVDKREHDKKKRIMRAKMGISLTLCG